MFAHKNPAKDFLFNKYHSERQREVYITEYLSVFDEPQHCEKLNKALGNGYPVIYRPSIYDKKLGSLVLAEYAPTKDDPREVEFFKDQARIGYDNPYYRRMLKARRFTKDQKRVTEAEKFFASQRPNNLESALSQRDSLGPAINGLLMQYNFTKCCDKQLNNDTSQKDPILEDSKRFFTKLVRNQKDNVPRCTCEQYKRQMNQAYRWVAEQLENKMDTSEHRFDKFDKFNGQENKVNNYENWLKINQKCKQTK